MHGNSTLHIKQYVWPSSTPPCFFLLGNLVGNRFVTYNSEHMVVGASQMLIRKSYIFLAIYLRKAKFIKETGRYESTALTNSSLCLLS